MFRSIPEGLTATANMVFCIMLIAGVVEIYKYTNVVGALINSVLKASKRFNNLIIIMIFGGILDWSHTHMATSFLIGGVIVAILNRVSLGKSIDLIVDSCKGAFVGAAIIARSVQWGMAEGGLIDPLVHGLSSKMQGTSTYISTVGMFLDNFFINALIPSGSGQATAVMPIMVPQADMLGITRQTAVLAFQYGDGISNTFWFTNGPLLFYLGLAKVLSEHRDELECTVKFIFQPAEEDMDGAVRVLASGELDDLDTVAGMHIFPKLPAGTISVDPGPRYTSAGFMKIKIIGKSGHGAMPESAVDPIYVGAKVVDALQSIASRETNPNDTVVVSICTFHCGTLANAIAETAELSGTVRTFAPQLRKELPDMIERIIKNTCEAYRASYEFDYYLDIPATITDARCSQISQRAVANSIGKEHLIQFAGTPGGEDFAFYLERFPGVYAFVGCRTPENDCLHELHSDKFNLDEASMANGATFYVQYPLEAQKDFA